MGNGQSRKTSSTDVDRGSGDGEDNDSNKEVRNRAGAVENRKNGDGEEAVSIRENGDGEDASSSNDSKDMEGQRPQIWYRHSGQPEIKRIPPFPPCKLIDEQEIELDLANHHITHMFLENGMITRGITPHLKAVKLRNVNLSQLDWLKPATGLKELRMSFNNMSAGLPSIIGQFKDLVILRLVQCQLTDLPESFSSLSLLKELFLNNNDFSRGLPAAVAQLRNLATLHLVGCQLGDFPIKIDSESQLQDLDLSYNKLVEVPAVVYRMANLRILGLAGNSHLVKINRDISQLQQLEKLFCGGCESLQSPPFAVCEQGLSAMRQYFVDLAEGSGKKLLPVPVAVVGMTGAGKSSLIRSLKSGKRELTQRNKNPQFDETTEVFAMEDLSGSCLKFIDYGGHDVYHMAYQLVIQERCIPLIVVNMEEVHSSLLVSAKEGARRLCVDWLSHLYVSCPRLGPPVLILTHTDKLDAYQMKDCREKLLSMSERVRKEILDECTDFSSQRSDRGETIFHFTNIKRPLFDPADIFEFNNDLCETTNIQKLRRTLEMRSQSLIIEIPKRWQKVENFVKKQTSKPFIPLSKVLRSFVLRNPKVILRYMHNTGQVLFFDKIRDLSGYIFHKIPALTQMISLLFHHSAATKWNARVEKFCPFEYQGKRIGKHKYQSFIQQFASTGFIDEALLVHLFMTDSEFPADVAMQLLKSFYIMHGPIEREPGQSVYILPYFAQSSTTEKPSQSADLVPLQLDIALSGLSPPPYVYQLMTVAVLKRCPAIISEIKVERNGASIYSETFSTHISHDSSIRVVSLHVRTTVTHLPTSWKHLIETAKDILRQFRIVWKGSYAEILVYCSQCLLSPCSEPHREVDPNWFYPIDDNYNTTMTKVVSTSSQLAKVTCPNCSERNVHPKPAVPKPLRFPCDQPILNEVGICETLLLDSREGSPLTPAPHPPGNEQVGAGDKRKKHEEGAERAFIPTQVMHGQMTKPDTCIKSGRTDPKLARSSQPPRSCTEPAGEKTQPWPVGKWDTVTILWGSLASDKAA
ncbi:uncharacterized protein [Watersipora subatra]|uniref:uncharacterized protein n=1 Tax=Watersipora subatra TaxID=2589382 RepID=UPI00355BD49C